MEVKSVSKERNLNLEHKKRSMTNLCYLETYNPLLKNFNSITIWLNLTYVDLSNNMITILPKVFGTLPHLMLLDLSKNCLGNHVKWPWLEQTAIKNTLRFLDISANSLIELPRNIEGLNVLITLNVSNNMLKHLPYNIGNMQELKALNLRRNRLAYFPQSIFHLRLVILDISMNQFETFYFKIKESNQIEKNATKNEMLSLVDLSANIMLQNRTLYDGLPHTLTEYLQTAKRCSLCSRGVLGLLPSYSFFPAMILAHNVIHISNNYLLFENYKCYTHQRQSYDRSVISRNK